MFSKTLIKGSVQSLMNNSILKEFNVQHIFFHQTLQSSGNIWTSNKLNSRQLMLIKQFHFHLDCYYFKPLMLIITPAQGCQASRGGGGGGKLSRASHSLSSTKSDPGQWPGDGKDRFKLRRNFSSFLSKPYLSTSCRWGVTGPTLLRYLIKFATVGQCTTNCSPAPAPS